MTQHVCMLIAFLLHCLLACFLLREKAASAQVHLFILFFCANRSQSIIYSFVQDYSSCVFGVGAHNRQLKDSLQWHFWDRDQWSCKWSHEDPWQFKQMKHNLKHSLHLFSTLSDSSVQCWIYSGHILDTLWNDGNMPEVHFLQHLT